ncbi:Ubiquitin carboxyl-terminal hydrolase 22 [Hypsizygus marmoreus]|uniref:Ubiquitin carboxyl-terminal hydrolase n=1 Tax=Hypsizygus marmoreus TaxID=39966 RepID=A0A369K293_HYPMA|nr:Ubiquitin carboxyl-terminal hydrolase 22 [Hypsizygus marmoreus]
MTDISRPCPHIIDTLAEEGHAHSIISKYKLVLLWSVNRFQAVTNTAKRRKISSPLCATCNLFLARPFACLHCLYIGCWDDGHVVEHLNEESHTFCVDAKTGSVLCIQCNDFIYDAHIDEIRLATLVMAEEQQTRFQVAKKPREAFKPWVPSEKDIAALEGAVAIPCQGRRGLLNLGQTCFLNVVLQSFVHNPLLRNYFLGDKHNWKQCKVENCTCCEMDKLFTEIYSEDPNPYGPITFLATTWRASAELSGYAQQDAHEFFISALNQIHGTSRGSTNVSCNCIIHSTFAGQLQSDVKCERCGNVTSTVDPMLDISLELRGKGGEVTSGENTLAACLRRFTQPEKLGPKEYSCGKCGKASHEASKRLSIRKLPPVLSFQFKRFEHKTTDKNSARKIDAPIRFPASFSMAPFTTLAMKETEKENNVPHPVHPGPDAMYEYDLFAVINHEGKMNNGHYTNFARFQDEWYRFDDDKVTPSTLGACLNSAAYMCFYVKRHLDYKPYMTPTYVLARETEAVREKEIEKEKEAARMKEVEDALLATV